MTTVTTTLNSLTRSHSESSQISSLSPSASFSSKFSSFSTSLNPTSSGSHITSCSSEQPFSHPPSRLRSFPSATSIVSLAPTSTSCDDRTSIASSCEDDPPRSDDERRDTLFRESHKTAHQHRSASHSAREPHPDLLEFSSKDHRHYHKGAYSGPIRARENRDNLEHPSVSDQAVHENQGNKKKRRRVTGEELRVLEKFYTKRNMPGLEEREKIGKQVSMTAREVQIWFQNRRQRDKREIADALAAVSSSYSSPTISHSEPQEHLHHPEKSVDPYDISTVYRLPLLPPSSSSSPAATKPFPSGPFIPSLTWQPGSEFQRGASFPPSRSKLPSDDNATKTYDPESHHHDKKWLRSNPSHSGKSPPVGSFPIAAGAPQTLVSGEGRDGTHWKPLDSAGNQGREGMADTSASNRTSRSSPPADKEGAHRMKARDDLRIGRTIHQEKSTSAPPQHSSDQGENLALTMTTLGRATVVRNEARKIWQKMGDSDPVDPASVYDARPALKKVPGRQRFRMHSTTKTMSSSQAMSSSSRAKKTSARRLPSLHSSTSTMDVVLRGQQTGNAKRKRLDDADPSSSRQQQQRLKRHRTTGTLDACAYQALNRQTKKPSKTKSAPVNKAGSSRQDNILQIPPRIDGRPSSRQHESIAQPRPQSQPTKGHVAPKPKPKQRQKQKEKEKDRAVEPNEGVDSGEQAAALALLGLNS